MTRKKIVAGNWKMNNGLQETEILINELLAETNHSGCEVMVAPSFVSLKTAIDSLNDNDIEVVSQNVHQSNDGAYTGEVSAKMLSSIGIKTTIIGHSERREYFSETHEILKNKVDISLQNSIKIIFCFGEELKDRKTNNHFNIISNQISESLFHLSSSDWDNIILAYEPIWAIGTGETASSDQVQEMHSFIRNFIGQKYSNELAQKISILYGGSVKPNNAKEIFSMTDVDGGLIGGASLKSKDFFSIVNSF
ncbi:triose-phosphate isomerase [Flavobacteriaceae bacterium]|jgi:triosephosphate isomerase|nr:triose-phosphate isomerase [Flavobacteriales bacterium]MBL6878076.1 triose-phosphate isomerase [Flavobacteriaceae bacterium]MDA9849493.1 triose-phosphate isomerase [Flavobacteriaceae bacterium]